MLFLLLALLRHQAGGCDWERELEKEQQTGPILCWAADILTSVLSPFFFGTCISLSSRNYPLTSWCLGQAVKGFLSHLCTPTCTPEHWHPLAQLDILCWELRATGSKSLHG